MGRLAVIVFLVLTACSPSATPEEAQRIAQTGWNATGLTSWTAQDWVRLADAGCRRGAWDPEVARELALEALRGQSDLEQPQSRISDEDLGGVVWLITLERCPDRFPPEIRQRGPSG